jgi:hypothetical protein
MRRLRFLHIPKTAGATITHCLTRLYPGIRIIFPGNLKTNLEMYQSLSAEEKEQLQLVMGHAPRITGIPEIDQFPTITFLRDPVSRAISFCQHVREGKSQELTDRFPPDDFDLDAFLDSHDPQLDNLYARYLLGNTDYEHPAGEPPQVLAQRAVDILVNDLDGFGITEYFDTSLLLFRHQFQWGWPIYTRLNIKDKMKSLSVKESHIEKIKAMNQIDLLIYQRAVEVFKERVRQDMIYITSRGLLFKLAQAKYSLSQRN